MHNLHRVPFCTCIVLDDIMPIDCLTHKYFVYRFSLFGYNIWYCVVCDNRGTPQISQVCIYQKSEFLKLIIIRTMLMCAVHTLPYLSHKMVLSE